MTKASALVFLFNIGIEVTVYVELDSYQVFANAILQDVKALRLGSHGFQAVADFL